MYFFFRDYTDNVPGLVIVKKSRNFYNSIDSKHTILEIDNVLQLYLKLIYVRYEKIFTPTPHPLPFLKAQFIVFHDLFPFKISFWGVIKIILLNLAALSTKLHICHINKSMLSELKKLLRMGKQSYVYMPNRLPEIANAVNDELEILKDHKLERLIIGLIGTDSSKKNYDTFLPLIFKELGQNVKVRIYGNLNPYIINILSTFKAYKIELVVPDQADLVNFLKENDCVCSVSTDEGFARPLAMSLIMGIEVHVVDCAVYNEFYKGMAMFHDNPQELVGYLKQRKGPLEKNPKLILEFVEKMNSDYNISKVRLFEAVS